MQPNDSSNRWARLATIWIAVGLISVDAGAGQRKGPAQAWDVEVLSRQAASVAPPGLLVPPRDQEAVILEVEIGAPAAGQGLRSEQIFLTGAGKKRWPLVALSSAIEHEYSLLRIGGIAPNTRSELVAQGATVLSAELDTSAKSGRPSTRLSFTQRKTRCWLVFFAPTGSPGLRLRFAGRTLGLPARGGSRPATARPRPGPR